ncbi:MAG: hypothetical protein HDR04_16850 [Lachnospiraceae bacterium]|nr:hypothetical protein [Lachnospiraceae bacterium]
MNNERIDLLDRVTFIENVIKLVEQLSVNKKGCCFAIEGSWGIGKTFVIEEVEKQLKILQSEDTNDDRYFVFHYNCWQHDYYEEPAVAIISAMIASIQEDKAFTNVEFVNTVKAGYKFVGEKLKEIAGMYIENKIGVNLVDLVEDIKKKKENDKDSLCEFDEMFNFSQTIEKVRKNLQEIAEKRTVVLIVDELDRCIPQYAIKVLERLHHIFYGLENVIVVMAIDKIQLEHSVEEMFGIRKDDMSIDVEKYLKKFIDFSMVLGSGVINKSFAEKYKFYFERFSFKEEPNDMEMLSEILPELFNGIDIRRQEKIIEKANIVHSLICNQSVDGSVLAFELMYEVLIVWGFDNMKYVALINDAQYTELEKRIGKEKVEFLKSMEEKAYHRSPCHSDIGVQRKMIISNLYGKIFWYFANLFNNDRLPYEKPDSDKQSDTEINTIKKYCQICEMIK